MNIKKYSLIMIFLFGIMIILLSTYLFTQSNRQKNHLLTTEESVLQNDVDSEKIMFEGKIVMKEFYGPPNYGENPDTDVIEHPHFLILHMPTLIEVGGVIKNISELQLIFINIDFIKYKEIINDQEEYIISGDLFLAHTGHHHSEVLISVNELFIKP
jgi:hypothetical protein